MIDTVHWITMIRGHNAQGVQTGSDMGAARPDQEDEQPISSRELKRERVCARYGGSWSYWECMPAVAE